MAAPFALIFGEGLSEPRFLCPSGTRNARFFVLRHRFFGLCPKPRQGAKGSVCPLGTWAKGPKRPAARRREASARWAVAAKGGKATRRREQIQGLRAVSAQNADICERANTRAARGQRAERRYLRGAGGKAAGEVGGRRNPVGKDRQRRAFPTRSYSILASASLTSSIRRATWEGVSTGWLNSTVWFTVTGAAACVCAASRS